MDDSRSSAPVPELHLRTHGVAVTAWSPEGARRCGSAAKKSGGGGNPEAPEAS
ncbi:hypothetical protein [Streptomyces sp. NP160]|uniref:hypothetical protein n=1 Tax=Streptomyces sp. NP160 TaxID=2586637 RepID=UPI0015D5F4E5|nr:hypothetical protein [Streptomyces sp. NP160]